MFLEQSPQKVETAPYPDGPLAVHTLSNKLPYEILPDHEVQFPFEFVDNAAELYKQGFQGKFSDDL